MLQLFDSSILSHYQVTQNDTLQMCSCKHTHMDTSVIFGFDSNVFVIFKGCNFSSNTAMTYRGAIDITAYHFFDNIEAASLIEFIDWLVTIHLLL